MRRPSPVLLALVCLAFAAPAWAQAVPSTVWPSPVIYVSMPATSTTNGQIFSVDAKSGAVQQPALVSTANADYEGLVVGPNPSVVVATDPNTETTTVTSPVLVYACDRAGGKIIRFDPQNSSVVETIYDASMAVGSHPLNPQCGRIASGTMVSGGKVTPSEDLIITDTAPPSPPASPTSGWWKISGIAGQALKCGNSSCSNLQTPTSLKAQAGLLESTGLKNSGDLLIVDEKDGQVFRSSAASSFSDSSQFGSVSGLTAPFGIARRSFGQVYVSHEPSNKPTIAQFNANGTANGSCKNFTVNHAKTAEGMQMSPGDTLYVAGTSNSGGGALFAIDATNANGCLGSQTILSSSFAAPLMGVALALPSFTSPSTPPANANLTTANGTGVVSFGYAAFEIDSANGVCSLSVIARPVPPAFITDVIDNTGVISPSPMLPVPPPTLLAQGTQGISDSGWDGFQTVAQTTTALSATCMAADGTFHFLLAAQLPTSLGSPQSVSCSDDFGLSGGAGCGVDTQGSYPLSANLPSDNYTGKGGKITGPTCQFFFTNSGPASEAEAGNFCGFEPTLTNTFNPLTGAQDPTLAAPFKKSGALSVKFRLADQGASCSSTNAANFIGDAVALLSLEQIADSKGNPVSVPIQISTTGGSSPVEPIFNVDGNKNYTFNLQLSNCTFPSGATMACPSGTYALTVTLLTANTADTCLGGAACGPNNPNKTPQSIYTTQTTLFILQ